MMTSTQFRTASKGLVDVLNLKPSDVCIEDIAASLAKIARFLGHTPQFISVAEHSLSVAAKLHGTPAEIHGLLHDAAESYLGDIPGPWKHLVVVDGIPFDELESRLLRVVYQGLNIEWPSLDVWENVKRADRETLREEQDQSHDRGLIVGIHDWVHAARAFLTRYRVLKAGFIGRRLDPEIRDRASELPFPEDYSDCFAEDE